MIYTAYILKRAKLCSLPLDKSNLIIKKLKKSLMDYFSRKTKGNNRDRTGWITKISKWSESHEIFFHRVIFIVDFESELRTDKNFSI